MTRPLGPAAAALFALIATVAVGAERPRIAGAWLGVGEAYKIGAWAPLRVRVEGGSRPEAVSLVAITTDSDGVGVATEAPGKRPLSTEPGIASDDRLYVRVGQQNAPVEVRLYAEGKEIDRRVLAVGEGDPEEVAAGKALPLPNAATDRVILQAGTNLSPASDEDQGATGFVPVAWPVVTRLEDLPRDAIGYDGIDVVLLVAGARAAGGGGWLAELTADDPRVKALVEWVEAGGRLVLSCGSAGADLVAPGGPLATFLPADFVGPGSISDPSGIEQLAEVADGGSIDLAGGALPITKLAAPRGVVLASVGQSADQAPLVVRAPRGFGETTFVAFDLDAPPLAAWKGRQTLVRRLSVADFEFLGAAPPQPMANPFVGDLLDSLLARLDREFTGVRSAPFLAVVGLVLLYLLLIGPGDYYFVKKVVGRVEATWVTFPLIVAVTSAAAYAGAYWLKGDRLRVNTLEVIDVDAASGRVRGTLVTHLFSPRAARYDLSLEARSIGGAPVDPQAYSTAWLGKPGYGLGGMQARSAGGASAVRPQYRIDATPLIGSTREPQVAGLPVQVWSTKSLVSDYLAATDRLIDARLTPDGSGLVEGTLTNDTGAGLTDCRLLYGPWAWRLGDLGDGETTTVDPSVSPVRVTTLLAPIAAAETPYSQSQRVEGSVEVLADAFSVGSLASGGGAMRSNRCLHKLDLGRLLGNGRALLLARLGDGPRSELTRPDGPLVPAESDASPEGPPRRSWVAVRFILPVEE